MKSYKEFNASEVPLEGSNLIEASAGTGKTFSIAILVLRLILENRLSVKEILMVTFTKAAVAELEERIRLFIRQASAVSQGENIENTIITSLVHRAIARSSLGEVQEILKEATLFLDETSVLTIHSFCQQSLNEFAFETGQLFGADLLQDSQVLIDEEVNIFWRKYITSIPAELLSYLYRHQLDRSSFSSVVKEHLQGKRYFYYDSKTDYKITDIDYSSILSTVQSLEEKKVDLVQYVIDNAQSLRALSEANASAKRANFPALVDEPEKFIAGIKGKATSQYIQNIYSDIIEGINTNSGVEGQIEGVIQELIVHLNCMVISEASTGIEQHKRIHNQLFYDDLIVNLHDALVEQDNPALVNCLQQKYKAVFIDEFQDTDRLQYEIFEKAFADNTIVFYIGDPKQSIYSWRKADLFTYFKARQSVDQVYGMNQNYRSSEALIDAMNLFFKPEETFDTFHFQDEASAIEYIKVDSPSPNKKGDLLVNGNVEAPISITTATKKEEITEALVAQVIELLDSKSYHIQKGESSRPVRPADIGILVRGNQEGKDIKSELSKAGIPAVLIGDAKVLKSEEAQYLLFILEAIVESSLTYINKALLSPFVGYTIESILKLDEEKTINLFRSYKNVWEKDGIYAALNTFIHDFKVMQVLLSKHTEAGERVATNLFQLIELLHKSQTTKRFSPLEMIGWLRRAIEGDEQEGDEFEQRIESDAESIKIVTIHKSKGLEYNIVFAPFLDLNAIRRSNKPFQTCSFRDPDSGEYVSLYKSQLTDDQRNEEIKQSEQENRRLIYVAVTRAVYKCFLYKNTSHFFANSSLTYFINALQGNTRDLIIFKDKMIVPPDYRYLQSNKKVLEQQTQSVNFRLLQPYWRKMSYTMLSAEPLITSKNKLNHYQTSYDKFIFHQLVKGPKTGNMLHFIFENIDFNHQNKWEVAINNAIQRYAPLQIENYAPNLKVMLEEVMNATIDFGERVFKLTDITREQCIHELEFDFTVSPFHLHDLARISNENMEIRIKDYKEIEGVMNGKIDLFFEHKGQYYVLDWKSNFLGDSLEDYSNSALAKAMNENNYHLQHLIYTLAIKKYLESRIPNFDYERHFGGVIYLFIRGVRKDSETGVYTYKPELEVLSSFEKLLSMARHAGSAFKSA